jgi:hypothetical protein
LDRARNAIAVSDKVLLVHSVNSTKTDWVRSEVGHAEELECRLRMPLIVYLRLDEERLPDHDHHRIAITAAGKYLREVGEELLHAIVGRERDPSFLGYNEDEPLV